MLEEARRFLVFIVLLSAVSVLFSQLRSLDREFLNADSGITSEDSRSLSVQKSFIDSYLSFWKGILRFDLGPTESGDPVLSHIGSRFLPTFHLASFAIIWSVLFAIGFAFFALLLKSSWLRIFLETLSQIILSTPIFVFAVVLLVLFFFILGWLPPGGYESWNSSYVILPGLALGSRVWARLFRFSFGMAETESSSAYVTVLRARGYSPMRILFRHILLKILPVLLVLILLDFSSLLSGAIVVEEIFFFPGIGKSMYHAIRTMDAPLLSALLFYSGTVFYILTRISERVRDSLLGWETQSA
ncbi:ABC transporter, permease protein [Leptospira broomii serovar Hurstbridge str. 5399]|uniref:ABC transporter, permease protein n=1 Tax=Leptospira broomii serovar Hurstbridge str. 5399 TaxID=1049789 RepID=T0GFL6_9LEPT|nr:ABC transporter permease [Leptospira broomii]EQA45614.1 ABC transporter, permease protein [Leptospira broomii serovar Hurstbridge str. 5399]